MNTSARSIVGGWIAVLALSAATTGCSFGSTAHINLEKNTRTLLDRARKDPTLPGNAATFCLDRARNNYERADAHSNVDRGLLITSAIFGASGVTMQALGAALPTPSKSPDFSAKKGFEVAGVSSIALAAGLLTIRTAAGQNEMALAERTAAARQVDAALTILVKYALAEDFKEVTNDGFGSCRDADINVAESFPGSAAGEALQKKLAEAQSAKEDTKKEAKEAKSQVAEKKADATTKTKALKKADDDLQQATKKREESKKRGDKTAEAQAQTDEQKAQQAKIEAQAAADKATEDAKKAESQHACKDTEATVADKKNALLKTVAALRRALFFGTNAEVETAEAELKQADQELRAARKLSGAACGG